MWIRRTILVAVVLACGITASAQHGPAYWPSDQEQQLEELDSQLLDTQQKLFAARQQSDTDEVERLSKAFKECQDKRLGLLRAMGHLPRED
jgi:hypothetical protein